MKGSAPRRLDELTVAESAPLTEIEVRALRAASLAGPALEVDRVLLARLLVERERVLAIFEAASLLIEELEAEGLIEPPGDDATKVSRYAVVLRRYMDRST